MSSDITIEEFSETAESAQLILENVTMLSELSTQLKKETKNGESYLNSLNSLLFQAGKDVSSLNQCVDSLITVAKRLVHLSLQIIPYEDPNFKYLKTEADKLLNVLEEIKNDEEDHLLDAKWRRMDKSLKENLSNKSLHADEKYPDHCSKESLLDMSNVIMLPTVHEDVFADFHRPSRTLSSSSLKNLRKVKLCLQKVCDEDDNETTEDSSTTPLKVGLCTKENCVCPVSALGVIHNATGVTHNLSYIQEEPSNEKTI